ncbi:MAG: hypothetical protein Q8L34_06900, partial [Candidatus Woesearchaeota archaeon]|nr:hypothetical protein [Candidatus Woesearchaeota archaeon]
MIRTRQLAYQYPGGAELRFEDIDVAQGGVLLLRGASGSGKSTWLALARAVLLQPIVILADEPTASLDDEAATQAVALLQATAMRYGATLVIAT